MDTNYHGDSRSAVSPGCEVTEWVRGRDMTEWVRGREVTEWVRRGCFVTSDRSLFGRDRSVILSCQGADSDDQ